MELDGEFLFIALILSIIAGIAHNITSWLHVLIRPNPSHIMTISLILSPVIFAFSVILPFILMYSYAKKINPEANLIPILIGTFFGTWIGQLISNIGVHTVIIYSAGSYYGTDNILQFGLTLTWQIIALSLSSTLFVLATAILLAHYQNRKEAKPPQPPT